MTDSGYVHYIIIVDRSGSMRSICADTEGGLRTFIDAQLEGVDAARRTVSFFQFDDRHDQLHDFVPLAAARDYQLKPRGWTALLDAVGTAITRTGEKLAALPEDRRPGYVMVLIATDGQENCSTEYTRAQVRDMITHQQEKYDWRFTYLGANQDVFTEAASIGIRGASTLRYYASGQSTRDSWAAAATAVSNATTPTSTGIYYTQQQREQVRPAP